MSYTTKLFRMDLETVKLALKKRDFAKLNMYCNRIMSNAHLLNTPDPALCGLLIKDMCFMVNPLKATQILTWLMQVQPYISQYYEASKLIMQKVKRVNELDKNGPLWQSLLSALG